MTARVAHAGMIVVFCAVWLVAVLLRVFDQVWGRHRAGGWPGEHRWP